MIHPGVFLMQGKSGGCIDGRDEEGFPQDHPGT
jgi:hypothetical protein